jgi:potassium efflux system protein
MQEIFGNLMAGIILLFEQPIRVGDVVTIGENTGKVYRIRIRSTTIRQADKREVIVPNKEIIMGQLINWTLSDSMTRLELLVRTEVGVDVEQVIQILSEEMKRSDQTLDRPEPFAILQEISESFLIFRCFAYVPEMRQRKFAKTDVLKRVLERFRSEGITIPYPKYDLRMVERKHTQSIEG